MENQLIKQEQISSEIASCGGGSERLKMPAMVSSIQQHGLEAVRGLIMASISKCSEALQINLNNSQVEMLADDILEVYKYDSLQDVMIAIKRGRQGAFGKTYKQLNMITIREWMAVVLEEKAEIRERELAKLKAKDIQPLQEVDYEAYRIRMAEEKSKKKQEPDESEYNRFKQEWLKKRNQDEQG